MHENWMVLDIETRPDPMLQDDEKWWAHRRSKLEPDGRLTDPLKIAADLAKKEQKQRDEMALVARTGLVVVIGAQPSAEPKLGLLVAPEANRYGEGVLLQQFASYLRALSPHMLVGWHLKRFDLPYITSRCVVHGIELPWWPKPRDYRQVVDLADDLGLEGPLTEWSYILGGEFKQHDGDELAELSLQELAEHCRQDVELTTAIAERTQFVWGRDR